jgi:nicotinamidase-related amidase
LKKIDRRSALIVIDVQLGFDDPAWGARNNPLAEACVALLIKTWREAGAPLLHVHHCSASAAGYFRPGSRGIEPKPQAMPRTGEAIYHKRVNSAFIGTALEADLRKGAIDTVVMVGLTTNHCVSTSVRMAGNLGFETYVVSDATATFARAGADGRSRCAEEVHNAALGDLQGEFAEVVDTQRVIESMTLEMQGYQGRKTPCSI